MKLPSLSKSIRGNTDSIIQSMNITEKPQKKWDQRKYNPRLVAQSVRESREIQNNQLENLRISSLLRIAPPEEKFIFLTVKYYDGLYSPVGFLKSFDNKIELFMFSQEIGRPKVRIGKTVYDVSEEIAKYHNKIKEENYKLELQKQVAAIRSKLYGRNGD